MFHSGACTGYLALIMSGKPSENSAAVFSYWSIQRITFRSVFGGLFSGTCLLLPRQTLFGGVFGQPFRVPSAQPVKRWLPHERQPFFYLFERLA